MTAHDPLCLLAGSNLPTNSMCSCGLIAEVRERIAEEFAALYNEAKHQMRAKGYDAYTEGRMDAFDRAESIARGGESDE